MNDKIKWNEIKWDCPKIKELLMDHDLYSEADLYEMKIEAISVLRKWYPNKNITEDDLKLGFCYGTPYYYTMES